MFTCLLFTVYNKNLLPTLMKLVVIPQRPQSITNASNENKHNDEHRYQIVVFGCPHLPLSPCLGWRGRYGEGPKTGNGS